MRRATGLPVSVELPGTVGQEVTGYVEVEAGWQVVAAGGPPTPALALRTEPAAGPPCIVVVDGEPSARQVRDGLLAGALDVLGWPEDRHRLLQAPHRLASGDTARRGEAGPPLLRIAGLSGGAGASTLALAVGGVLAWSGHRTIVVGEDDLLVLCGLGDWTGPGAVELASLDAGGAAAELPGLLRPVPGVDRLTVLGGAGASVHSCAGWPVDAVVADLRDHTLPDPGMVQPSDGGRILVSRPDATLRRAAGTPPALPVILMGPGPLDRAGARRLLGRRPAGWLPASARVARAGLAGRVPASLPGTWVATLRTLLTRVRP